MQNGGRQRLIYYDKFTAKFYCIVKTEQPGKTGKNNTLGSKSIKVKEYQMKGKS